MEASMDDTTQSANHSLDFVTPWAPEPDPEPEVVVVDLTEPESLGLVIELREAFAKIDTLAEEVTRLRRRLDSTS